MDVATKSLGHVSKVAHAALFIGCAALVLGVVAVGVYIWWTRRRKEHLQFSLQLPSSTLHTAVPGKLSPGDTIAWSTPAVDVNNGNQIGIFDGVYTVVGVDSAGQQAEMRFSGTLLFSGASTSFSTLDSISLSGSIGRTITLNSADAIISNSFGHVTIGIIGGTGKYSGCYGSWHSNQGTSPNSTDISMDVTLAS